MVLNSPKRRTVLKTFGAGVMGSAVLASPAVADDDKDKGNDYGSGNGVGAFLNEEAPFNPDPWDGEIVNKKGETSVEIKVGADPPSLAFSPQAVLISPGTEVTWKWKSPVHHSVVSYNENADDPTDPTSTGDHGKLFEDHGVNGNSLVHTFDERTTQLYFCHPHGTPYPAYDPFFDDEDKVYNPGEDSDDDEEAVWENAVGMRGAVLVRGE